MDMTKTKAWVAGLFLVLSALSGAFADDVFDGNEIAGVISTVITAALGIYAVYRVPNKPTGGQSATPRL